MPRYIYDTDSGELLGVNDVLAGHEHAPSSAPVDSGAIPNLRLSVTRASDGSRVILDLACSVLPYTLEDARRERDHVASWPTVSAAVLIDTHGHEVTDDCPF